MPQGLGAVRPLTRSSGRLRALGYSQASPATRPHPLGPCVGV